MPRQAPLDEKKKGISAAAGSSSTGECGLKILHLWLKMLKNRRHAGLGKSLVHVLTAIHIAGGDGEQDGTFGPAGDLHCATAHTRHFSLASNSSHEAASLGRKRARFDWI